MQPVPLKTNSNEKENKCYQCRLVNDSHDPERGRLQMPKHRQTQSKSHKVLEESQQECFQ